MSGETEYTAEMARAAAAKGAAWLDKRCPTWVTEIDLDYLNLERAETCILGQTAECLIGKSRSYTPGGGYFRVLRRRNINSWGPWPVERGFTVPMSIDSRELGPAYEMLDIAWRELIRERLEAPQ